MHSGKTPWHRIILGLLALGALVMAIGCSDFDSPTASSAQEENQPMWHPVPGSSIIPGHEIPILNPGYWDDYYGSRIEPLRTLLTVTLGPLGGVLNVGPHQLVVPQGAISRNTRFTVAVASDNAVALDCGPSGMEFSVPVRLVMSYVGTQYDDQRDDADLRIYYLPADGGPAIEQHSTVDRNTRQVTAEINHFSRYIIG